MRETRLRMNTPVGVADNSDGDNPETIYCHIEQDESGTFDGGRTISIRVHHNAPVERSDYLVYDGEVFRVLSISRLGSDPRSDVAITATADRGMGG